MIISNNNGGGVMTSELNPKKCWRAVLRRDTSADGTFVTAVKTTGIYCRPSCRCKQPLRKNVEFYPTAADAERAGYRACKRCRPNENGSLDRPQAQLIARACRQIVKANGTPPNLNTLAGEAGLSASHFHQLFKTQTGLTPKAYSAAHRADRLRDELHQSRSVTEAMHRAGFSSSSRLHAAARKDLGMPPKTFRARGEGMTIRYAITPSSLGLTLVAATERGICMIGVSDRAAELESELHERFARATIVPGDKAFEKIVRQVIAFVDRPAIGLDLPLDVRGTAFQQRVWQMLRKIPPGKTWTYAQLARAIGEPTATRAVANACGRNPVAIAIPCHRVVGSDGSLTGYHWGVARKAKLLEAEAAPTSSLFTNKIRGNK